MSYAEIVVIYLCVLTLYPVFYGVPVLISIRTSEVRRPLSRGEKSYLILRLLVFFFVAAIGWAMYFSSRLYSLVIPITAFLDFGGMFVIMLSSKRIVEFFDAKPAA
jgi:hypothetical protein